MSASDGLFFAAQQRLKCGQCLGVDNVDVNRILDIPISVPLNLGLVHAVSLIRQTSVITLLFSIDKVRLLTSTDAAQEVLKRLGLWDEGLQIRVRCRIGRQRSSWVKRLRRRVELRFGRTLPKVR